VFYCDRGKHHGNTKYVKFSVWHNPFRPKVWSSLLFGLVLITISFKLDQNVENVCLALLKLLSSSFGHESWDQGRYMCLVCGIAFLSVIYSNSLLSLITVVIPEEGLKTLKQLLDLGFKIVFLVKVSVASPQEVFEIDFKIHGLSDLLPDAFYFSNETMMAGIVQIMAKEGDKLAATHETSMSNFILKNIGHDIRRMDPNFRCFKLEQTLSQKMYFWKYNTENSFWMKITQQRLVESGLYQVWDKWSMWGHLLGLKLLNEDATEILAPEYIDAAKFFSILILGIVVLLISSIVFFTEICMDWKKKWLIIQRAKQDTKCIPVQSMD